MKQSWRCWKVTEEVLPACAIEGLASILSMFSQLLLINHTPMSPQTNVIKLRKLPQAKTTNKKKRFCIYFLIITAPNLEYMASTIFMFNFWSCLNQEHCCTLFNFWFCFNHIPTDRPQSSQQLDWSYATKNTQWEGNNKKHVAWLCKPNQTWGFPILKQPGLKSGGVIVQLQIPHFKKTCNPVI